MERDAKHASVPLHRVRAGELRLGGHFYELKAGPAATRLLDETPGNVVAVRLGNPERLSVSPVGLGGAPCDAGDGASRPIRTIPTPQAVPTPQ